MAAMQISSVAKEAGVGVETVRFYERVGLVEQPVKPANGGYRSYAPDIVDRIRLIRQAQSLGFSLKEIAELLALRADPTADCADVRARAQAKLGEVNQKIARLTAIRSALQNLISACPGDGVATCCCSILDALEPDGTGRASGSRYRRSTG